MKVILKEATTALGTIGEIVTVKRGYARNYLIPKGIALEATKGNLMQFEAEKETLVKRNIEIVGGATALAEKLKTAELTFVRKAGEESKLFGSVTSMDIAARLAEQGFDIEKRIIQIPEPIKSLGDFSISVKLHQEVTADLTVTVKKEDSGEVKDAEAAFAEETEAAPVETAPAEAAPAEAAPEAEATPEAPAEAAPEKELPKV
ncbi:MAG: 50S ribosomal protein L9 [Thermodesulfobacteriota bacterium]